MAGKSSGSKKGTITELFDEKKKHIGIDNLTGNRTDNIVDARLTMIQKMELKIGENVTYRQLTQGPDKDKINFLARSDDEPERTIESAKEEKVASSQKPAEPIKIVAKFLIRSGSTVTIQKENAEPTTFFCDLNILKIISEKKKVVPEGTYTWLITTNIAGDPYITQVGPASPEDAFKTGKEILQENLDHKKADDSERCKSCVFTSRCETHVVTDHCVQAFHDAAAVKAAAQKAKEDKDADMRMKENAEFAKQCAAEKEARDRELQEKTIEAQKAVVPTPSANEPEKVDLKGHSEPLPQVPAGAPSQRSVTTIQPPIVQRAVENAPMVFDQEKINIIKNTVAKGCTDIEFDLLMYLSTQYHLDPLRKQIWCVKYGDNPAAIFTGRDGFLQIAHRSGHFDGMKADIYRNEDGTPSVDKDGKILGAWCEVWRNDMQHSFRSDVLFKEFEQIPKYSNKTTLWQTKPSVMIVKVAESITLRKAFAISGLYAPEELDQAGV